MSDNVTGEKMRRRSTAPRESKGYKGPKYSCNGCGRVCIHPGECAYCKTKVEVTFLR